jgi:hypothetical protein
MSLEPMQRTHGTLSGALSQEPTDSIGKSLTPPVAPLRSGTTGMLGKEMGGTGREIAQAGIGLLSRPAITGGGVLVCFLEAPTTSKRS